MAMLCSGSIVLPTKNEKSHFSINYATVIQKSITSITQRATIKKSKKNYIALSTRSP